MKKILTVIGMASIMLSCEYIENQKVDSQDTNNEPYISPELKEKIIEKEKSKDFNSFNRTIYDKTITYEKYANFFNSFINVPIKHDNLIYFDDIVFISEGLNKNGRLSFISLASGIDEIDSMQSIISSLQEPITLALSYTDDILKYDIDNLAGLIADLNIFQRPDEDLINFVDEYFRGVNTIKLRKKDELKNRLSEIIYLEFGNDFNDSLFDNWYSIVETEFNSYLERNKELIEKKEREKELGIQ